MSTIHNHKMIIFHITEVGPNLLGLTTVVTINSIIDYPAENVSGTNLIIK